MVSRLTNAQVARQALRLLPTVDRVLAHLDDPAALLTNARSTAPGDAEDRADTDRPDGGAGLRRPGPGERQAVEDVLDSGRSAVEKVARYGAAAPLTEDERLGLESVVLTIGRPAILVQDGHFFPPPAGWESLEQHRADIEATMRSVGRVDVVGHPALDWIGTAFLVDTDAVVTNRHVVADFLDTSRSDRWAIDPGMAVSIDFAEELGSPAPREYPVTEILGMHPQLDLALLRVRATAATGPLPPPLPLTRDLPVQAQQPVYAVGYPAADSRRNSEVDITRIFAGIFNVKRLQPGRVTSGVSPQQEFAHDCSTLGGNSGSCLVDLASSQVLGVHSRGRYLVANYGICTERIVDQILASTR